MIKMAALTVRSVKKFVPDLVLKYSKESGTNISHFESEWNRVGPV